jgi:hypothetical protein
MLVIPQVRASDHRSHDAIAALLRQLPKDRLTEARGCIESPATLPRDPFDEVRANELSEGSAHVWEVQPRLLRDLHRCLRAGNHRGEHRFSLSTREDVGESVEKHAGS